MSLQHVHIVLAHPSEPRNVGAVCRAIKNADIARLTIVVDSDIDLGAARPLAVGARDVLDAARIVPDLPTALAGSVLIAGVTRRVGQRRKPASFAPWQLAEKVVSPAAATPGATGGTVSIVFGNEQSGLSDMELELCHMAVSIPSSPDFASLNLSHAVQVIVYELYIADLAGPASVSRTGAGVVAIRDPIDSEELATNVARIVKSLASLGFHSQAGPQGMRTFLSDILGRAMLSKAEVQRLRALFEKIEGMHGSADSQ